MTGVPMTELKVSRNLLTLRHISVAEGSWQAVRRVGRAAPADLPTKAVATNTAMPEAICKAKAANSNNNNTSPAPNNNNTSPAVTKSERRWT